MRDVKANLLQFNINIFQATTPGCSTQKQQQICCTYKKNTNFWAEADLLLHASYNDTNICFQSTFGQLTLQ